MPTVAEFTKHLKQRYLPDTVMAVSVWTAEDVKAVAEEEGIELPPGAGEETIRTIDGNQDATIGITWETIGDGIVNWLESHPQEHPCPQ